jgi:hypothetical protein
VNKKVVSRKSHDSGRTITTPSFYGSHAKMVVNKDLFDVELQKNEVICQDDDGYYITYSERLDTNLADPNRYSSRREAFLKKQENDN